MSDQESGTNPKTPVEQAVEHAVEVFVYAPIGLLFEGATLLPQLIEKGKSQVTMARMIGQFAVTQGQSEAEKLANRLPGPGHRPPRPLGGSTAPPAPVVPNGGHARRRRRLPRPRLRSTPPRSPTRRPVPTIEADTLAIPDYDGLSASHVVNRLAGLSGVELEAVRLYEMANRGRKTILSKVAQLQAG